MSHVKYDTGHHAGADAAARVANRLRNSGGDRADAVIQKGSSPTRTYVNLHHSANHVPPRDVRKDGA